MSQDLKNNPSEEIDLIQLFSFFEEKLKSVFKSLYKIIKVIFDVFVAFLKILQQYAIKLGALMIIAFLLGYAYDGYKPKIYSSTMMVKPMFDSKYQLYTNIEYYNALIADQNLEKMSSIFDITAEEASSLREFTMQPGPENNLEKIKAYDKFMKSVDSVTATMVDYDQFIEEMSVYNSSIYEIIVKSSQKNIFDKLYPGFKKTFETKYSINNKKKKDSIYKITKTSLEKQLVDVEALQKMYIEQLSKEQIKSISNIGGTPFVVGDDKKNTREFDVFKLSLGLRNQINTLNETAINQNDLFEIISTFPATGTNQISFTEKMKFMFPILVLILSLLTIFGIKFNTFIRTYKLN